jgi:hypothetical protein
VEATGLLLVFSAALFLSAALLFWVQLMFARMALPLLGGTPLVWNTVMVAFQATVLAGYLYAHLVNRRLTTRLRLSIHFGLLLLGLSFLPVALSRAASPPAGANPVLWLLMTILASVGFPSFAISATAPLLQSWFARTGHPAAADPYFLYSPSNVGSLAALLGYPLLMEPFLSLRSQSRLWAVFYGLLIILMAACALLAARHPSPAAARDEERGGNDPPPSRALKTRWLLLAMVPTSLLLGVTSHITEDIAPAPFIWVIPLSLYLLSFAVVFARRPALSHRRMVVVQPFVILPLAAVMALNAFVNQPFQVLFPLHLVAFFITVMVCHGELARTRPASGHLTGFYLWMAAGGVIGGLFNALLAPLIFKDRKSVV